MATNTTAESSSSPAAIASASAGSAAESPHKSSNDDRPCAPPSSSSSASHSPPPPPRKRGRGAGSRQLRHWVATGQVVEAIYVRRRAHDLFETPAKYASQLSALCLFDPQLASAFYQAARIYRSRPGIDQNMCLGTEEAIRGVTWGFMQIHGAGFFPNEESEARGWQRGLTLEVDWEAEKVYEDVYEYFRYMPFLRYEIRDRRRTDTRWGWDWERRRSA